MYNSYGTFYHNGYSELYHHGVKGQKHGTRRWQNADGSLTPEGYIHYGYGKRKQSKGKETIVYKNKALAKREKKLAKWNDSSDKSYAKGKEATTRAWDAVYYDELFSPKGKKKFYIQGMLVGSFFALHRAQGRAQKAMREQGYEAIRKLDWNNVEKHAPSKKDIQDVKNMTATKEMKSKINANNTTVKRDEHGRIASYKVSL